MLKFIPHTLLTLLTHSKNRSMKKVFYYSLILLTILPASCEESNSDEPGFYGLELEVEPINGGNVSAINTDTKEGFANVDNIPQGTNIQLTARSKPGFEFKYWAGSFRSTDTVIETTITTDIKLTAVFDSIIDTPVRTNGVIRTNKSKIVNESGQTVQLRGMSLFWSQWIGKYYNHDAINWLVQDWNIQMIRASMGVDDDGGYIENRSEMQKVETVIDAAINNGIYVIIDWHSHHAEDYIDEAVDFFSRISARYGDQPNIIYEIYNEPLNVSWKDVLKPYSERVIAAIRKNDPDNLIIVGTPNWSQDVGDVIGYEIDDNNVAYTFHFYASEEAHYLYLRNKVDKALANDIPIFVTEWGVSEASGNGDFNKEWTLEWLSFLNEKNLSWCNWSVADKDETSAALKPGAPENGSWSIDQLSESGKFIREMLRASN